MQQPLVSIVIPSYNAQYFEIALRSALGQSYHNIEIVVSDQCPTEEIRDICAKYPEVQYHRFHLKGGDFNNNLEHIILNYCNAIRQANSNYIKMLCDDDVLHPFCVETLVAPMLSNEHIALSFSKRQKIDLNNNLLERLETIPSSRPTTFYGRDLAISMLKTINNCIGEPSTALFRRDRIEWDTDYHYLFNGNRFSGFVDMMLWFGCLQHNDAFYTPEVLSYWRTHPEQETGSIFNPNRKPPPQQFLWLVTESMWQNNTIAKNDYLAIMKLLIDLYTRQLHIYPQYQNDITLITECLKTAED